MTTPCLFCGGDASEPNHPARCDGRQGAVEAVILDAELGERLRELAIVRVEAGWPDLFEETALRAVWMTALHWSEFTTDQVWVTLGARGQIGEKRALGPIMRRASGWHWIVATDRFVLTAQPLRHRAPVRVWRSLIAGSV
jgi:hypothetical protein